MDVRTAGREELDRLAEIWFEGWHDAHAEIVSERLVQARTLPRFKARLQAGLAHTRVAGPAGAAVGFYILKDDEVYQFFVAAESRGTGVAAALMADAEMRLRENGVQTAWLTCAIGNERAARFYEKNGWHRTGTMIENLELPDGVFPLEVWRYEKSLTG
jgi:GNAT superfamily N-acetyltransferase